MSAPRKPPKHPSELRCHCGRLVARQVPEGIELRCGRCKEPFLIRIEDGVIMSVVVRRKAGKEGADP